MELQRIDAALADAEAALRLTWRAPAHALHAKALDGLGRLREALDAAQAAADADPDDGRARAELAAYASKAGDAEGALTAARDACQLSSDDPSVLLAIVPILLVYGTDDELDAVLTQVRETAPGLDSDDLSALASTASAGLATVSTDRARDLADEIRGLLLAT